MLSQKLLSTREASISVLWGILLVVVVCGICACTSMHVCICTCVLRPEVDVGCLTQFSTLLFKVGSVGECKVHSFSYTSWPMSLWDPPLFLDPQHQSYRSVLSDTTFYKGAEDPNSGIHDCTVSILPMELFPQPCFWFVFLVVWLFSLGWVYCHPMKTETLS